ncbi:ROK family protein [Sporolactobacillus kofuensis]|uniref:ROK family protein n=1 Tax=Sporolactobacillus kofuensis TaxID=269672 RepID=A0ABW1WBH4_9BACL|nr:ROK family protein [Sporolactobacillus kofuensis]MCO7174815.1 ROK family protein [Sporolactobacillus kofuensis]
MDVVLAFDFGGTKVAAALADYQGQLLVQDQVESLKSGGMEFLKTVISCGQGLLARVDGANLVSIGIGMCGAVTGDHVELAPNLYGMEKLNLCAIMTDAFHVPAHMENDVKAAALAELHRGELKGTDYGLYVNFGTGVSVGLTCGDHVMRGHNGASGEIAYLMQNRNDKSAYQSGHASFEEFASGSGIARRASDHFGKPLSTKMVFELARNDEDYRAFIDEAASEIGYQIANLAIIWNPQKIVMGGGMTASFSMIQEAIEERLNQCVPYPPKLVLSHFQQNAGLYGAAELALIATGAKD